MAHIIQTILSNTKANLRSHHLRTLLLTLATMIASVTHVWGQTDITSLSDITDPTGHYRLTSDVSGSGHTSIATFSGILEAAIDPDTKMPYRITDLDAPLFTTLTGEVKNLVLEGVSISGNSGNTGAIAATANGTARIYNIGILSGSVGGTDNTGGLVGLLGGTAHVVNCYSFATITSGTNVGGIVGNNNSTTTASSINTMVMNCMFYGDITGGYTVSPVYGGTNIANLQGGLNTFNYYAYDELKTKAISNNKYNSALAVEQKYLNRFEFYRQLLNSNKKLAAFYATDNHDMADLKMLKWVLETADRTIDNPKPYPILKAQGKYPSIINPDFENAPDSSTVGRNHGGKLPSPRNTLTVTISSAQTTGGQTKPTGATITTGSLTLVRTDKDFDRFNYNYDKVQLPYYNDIGTGNYTGNRVVTGWKITAITAVEGDPYTAANYPTTGIKDFPDHNYADRRSSNKDLYSVSKRVFSQGAYFDVPYGVTSITIEPYWGKACYIADPNYDVVYKNDYSGKQNVSQTGTQVTVGTTTFNGQNVQKSIEPALNYIANNLGGLGSTVYDNALVLVGNLHLDVVPLNGDRPFTMMSVDMDNDHEPDYSLIYHHKGRTNITPIRFDFLNIPGTAQAQKPNDANLICNFTIVKTRGWFEVTNTTLVHSDQFEYENSDLGGSTKIDAPLILLGGVFDQFVSTQSKTVSGKTIFIHVGSNVWIKEFGMGTHSDGSESTPHVPVSVTGGEFPGFYLTGTYNANAKVRTDNAECYISGGYFHEAAGASLEQIDGNVHWQIYNADIDNFFGGGINEAKPIKGDITIDIYNSHVTLFCGGPKFGNMQANKNVTTNAEGCTFGKFFGAGYGGTSITKKKYYDNTSPAWGTTLQGYYTTDRGKYFDGNTTNSKEGGSGDNQYGKKGLGVATDFDYEFFVWTSGKTGGRFFVKFAAFSLAQCNDVESNLKKCTIEENFYGGGSLGKVVGTATSVLEDCTVNGSVYGAGYSASLPTIEVRDGGFVQVPKYNQNSGMFEPAEFSGTTTFTWQNAAEAGKTLTNGQSGSDLTNHILYTDADLTTLGQVAHTDLTIKGTTTVAGSVYGGGEESGVGGATEVNVESGTISKDVFGGGKEGYVGGGVNVNMQGGTVTGNLYGGGALANTNTNNVTAGYGTASETIPSTSTNTTTVNLLGGTIYGDAYGGGLGRLSAAATAGEKFTQEEIDAAQEGDPAYGKTTDDWKVQPTEAVEGVAALVYGDVNVNLGSSGGSTATAFITSYYTGDHASVVKSGRVFGCNNLNGSPKGEVTVTVYKTVPGNVTRTAIDKLKLKETDDGYVAPTYEVTAVYGGGNLADFTTSVAGKKANVIIESCDVSIRDVYGGGNAAAVPETNVLIRGAYEIQEVFGGGNGMDPYTTNGGTTWIDNPGANVNGNANTLMTGGYIHEAYGGSNYKGTISGTVSIDVGAGDGAPSHCDLDVDKIVGAGKNADIEGDLIMILGCKPDSKIPQLFGGADNANVHGNVELTITSGKFGQVFGGNNQGGAILGHIILNIEETGDCEVPIEIDELYLGGNEAAYSVYGYYDSGETLSNGKPKYLPRTAEMHAITDTSNPNYKEPITNPATDATHTFPYDQPVLNIISCTYIGKVFGGGLGTGAAMCANPTVNINMVQGSFANNTTKGVPAKMTELGLNSSDNPNNLGVLVDVYGGGNEADVNGNTTVNIGTEVGNDIVLNSPEGATVAERTKSVVGAFVSGTVYGAGKGKVENPDAAIVTGNTQVNMAGGLVRRSIYGGGELGSVGTFTEKWTADTWDNTKHAMHFTNEPKTCKPGTGLTKVIISGGQVGLVNQKMPAPDDPTSEDDFGYVFCACKGVADSITYSNANLLAVSDSSYLEINGGLIAASVYGGSENGEVLRNTHIKITGGQIGSGYYKENGVDHWDPAYTDEQWTAAINAVKSGVEADINTAAAPFHECDAWPFGPEGNRHVYDHYANEYDAKGGTNPGSDGHSYYGHVFGGGSGFYPFAAGKWRRTCGRVCGNTFIEITGGHILTNVYGGNEITDVLGHSKVDMSGGTVGVPRTIAGIQARPVNSYIFGAGMGDPRVLFNGWSNVASAEVIVRGDAVVFGSVFGGGEDGHVLGDVSTTIKGNAHIGTLGSSGVDGNIFGSGRGFSALALTAGTVCGNVTVNIQENAKILGSVFGGGRMAAVGTHLAEEGTAYYGVQIPDGKEQVLGGIDVDAPGKTHGNVTINITGGTIGNLSQMSASQYSIGDVFGGSKGTLMDDWAKSQMLGLVKNTNVNISQASASSPTIIYGNVYGGGEIASVGSYNYADATNVASYNTTHTTEPLTVGDVYSLREDGSGLATIKITGGTIGQSDPADPHGHVFGGCLGRAGTDYSGYSFVNRSVVTLENGTVYGSVFGGGENGHVLDETNVNIKGGSVGIRLDNLTGIIPDNAIYRGNVYGGGRGIDTYNDNGTDTYCITAGKVSGHTNVSITGGQIYRNVYGGGSLASVGDPDEDSGGLASVSITGGKIGTDGGYHNGNFVHLLENGHVFGSGRGVAGGSTDDFIRLAYVKNTEVTIGGTAYVTGSVFGSGENGHVRQNANVTINAGDGYSHEQAPTSQDIEPYPIIGYPLTQAEMVESPTNPVMIYRGNVYGGGRGIDHSTSGHLSETAGAVKGNTTVNINGGTIRHNIYGGGSLASTGNMTDENGVITYHDNTGLATININGGLIGMSPELDICKNGDDTYSGLNNGQVYGGARGVAAGPGQTAGSVESEYVLMAYVHDTKVNISGAQIFGSVFGGGANGHVSKDTEVNISGGEIGTRPSILGATSNYYYMDPANGIDGHVIYTGNVYGGGRGIDRNEEGGLSATAGRVYGNTKVNITDGTIYHNVYGGGSLASVGTFTKTGNTYNWTENTGKSEVIISGGTVGFEDFSMDDYLSYMGQHPGEPANMADFTGYKFNNGRVFGSGRGMAGAEYIEYAYVRDAYVTIEGTGDVKGCVFGSGENGHVKRNTYLEIKGGTIGYKVPSLFIGNVYGGGRGVDLDNGDVSVTAGRTEGNTNVTISGGKIYRDVYGGGSLASVGQANDSNTGMATVTIESGTEIGDNFCVANGFGGNVFGSGRGMVKLATGPDYSQMAYVNKTDVIVKGHVMGNVYGGGNAGHVRQNTHVQILDGANIGTTYNGNEYYGNVFGAGKGTSRAEDYSVTAGMVQGSVVVDMLGGTVLNDIYGGAALANSNTNNASNYGTASETISSTTTNTTTVNLVGGTLKNAYGGGQGDSETAAIVYGNASILLNGSTATGATNNCVVKGNIFGCNNINGTPKGHALVHIYKTQGWTGHDVTQGKADANIDKGTGVYEVTAVYGGGNMAAYEPTSSTETTDVIIDGCDLTSIEYVYGGGNAASAPATKVTVNGTYEIGTVFGGGNGKDDLPNGDPNPGAHVGFLADGTTSYGNGTADVYLYGGTIHNAFGGSNTKGNIRGNADVHIDEAMANGTPICPLNLDEVYGGGNEAEMHGGSGIDLGCITKLRAIYGGAKNANVGDDIVLTITSGHFDRVFGGNNIGGTINGSITINIEETGCHPITIGELYGCGNQAAYTAPEGKSGATINIKSFTSIGRVFGGGLGATATVTGNTTVNINEVLGEHANTAFAGKDITLDGTKVTLPPHTLNKIGSIGTVFGGGNLAKVIGNPTVNVGTESTVTLVSLADDSNTTDVDERVKTVVGADIQDNIYGGGNFAEVEGDPKVNIGK